jgi:transposase
MPKPGPRTTNRYSDEFKATAVRLSELPGVEVQDVAASLYIHPFMLSRWRKQAREGQIVTKGIEIEKDVEREPKELRKLKKAYERLQVEHGILKKPSSSLPDEKRRLRVHRPPQRRPPREDAVSGSRGEFQWLLCVEGPTPESARA